MIFDPLYFLLLAPAILLAGWAQLKVKSAYSRASQLAASSGLSGAETAAQILQMNGISGVAIEETPGHLSDHYDPRSKTLRLSQEVYHGRSLASLGIAAHEAGHALQDAKQYAFLGVRNAVVPLASFGSNLSWILLFVGMILGSMNLILAGIAFFSFVVFFQLVNLPVEFDASARAKAVLSSSGMVGTSELSEVRSVLSAAAMTYVAATLTAILTLVYYVIRSGVLGSRD